MNISSVTTGRSAYTASQNKNEIKMLEKQKEVLEKQLQTTKESEMDSKTKQQVIKDLQAQIQEVEAQIQQKRNENLTQTAPKDERTKQNSQTSSVSEQTTDPMEDLNSLVEASSSYTKARVLSSVKSGLEGRSGILEQEIKLDEGRGMDPKAKREELSEIKKNSLQLNKSLGEAMKTSDQTDSADKNKTIDTSAALTEKDQMESTAGGKSSEGVKQGEQKEAAEKENDSLTWLLEHNGQYNPVDVLV